MKNNGNGGTPNPLNPSIDGVKAKPVANSTNPLVPGAPAVKSAASKTASSTPSANSAAPTASATTLVPNTDPTAQTLDPTGRTMEQAPVKVLKKKKKTGLIVGIIAAIVLLIGGGIAAAVVLMNMNNDPVTLAMKKLMSGEAPKNVSIDGDIEFYFNVPGFPVSRVNIDLDSDVTAGSMINTTTAELKITNNKGNDYSVKLSELYSADGDLFFKIENAADFIEGTGLLDYVTGMMVNQDTEYTTMITNGLMDVIEAEDGVWIRISVNELAELKNGISTQENVSNANCLADLAGEVKRNSTSTANIYNRYPFIKSSKDNITISSKQSPVYKLGIDSEKFTSFANEISNSVVTENIASCQNTEGDATISTENVDQMINKMPDVYVEINANYDFTRLYLESSVSNGLANMKIDFGFDYPTSVNVPEPTDYVDFSDIVKEFTTKLLGGGEVIEPIEE